MGQVDARRGDWIQTYSGRQFWPLDPRASEIHLVDIAAALSRECRYGGHCLRFYSVAEHCVLMVRAARNDGGWGNAALSTLLLHDASEGLGLRDIPRPLKADLVNYKAIEADIMDAVAVRFGLLWPMPPALKDYDERIGLTEKAQNMAPEPQSWGTRFDAARALNVIIECWPPDRAFREFMTEAALVGVV